MPDNERYRRDNKKREKQLTKTLDLKNYHPIASKPRRSNKTRSGVAPYVEKSLKYTPRHFKTQIECTLIAVHFGEKILGNFCVVYRPQSHKMKDFLLNFEDLLLFLRTLKHYSVLFGDFNIDTLKENEDRSDYENLITAYCFKRQNSEPTRVTPTSLTCSDHLLISFPVKNETYKTTFNDHYTVIGEIFIDTTCSQEKQQNFFKNRNLKNIKGDEVVNFLFLLDQKLMKFGEEKLSIDISSRTILDCVDRFAPVRYASDKNFPSDN